MILRQIFHNLFCKGVCDGLHNELCDGFFAMDYCYGFLWIFHMTTSSDTNKINWIMQEWLKYRWIKFCWCTYFFKYQGTNTAIFWEGSFLLFKIPEWYLLALQWVMQIALAKVEAHVKSSLTQLFHFYC